MAAPPSEEYAKTHELARASYEPWRERCLAGRGQAAKRRRAQAESQPADSLLAQVDYLFIAADGSLSATGRESTTVLVAVDDRGVAEACVCTKKSPQDLGTIKVMTKYWGGFGAMKLVMQTDGENAI